MKTWAHSPSLNVSRTTYLMLACIFLAMLAFPAQAQVTLSGDLTGTYPTLAAAFNAINSGGGSGAVTVTITEDHDLAATAVLNQTGYTVTIQPSGNRIVSGAINAPLIRFNGADNATLDGIGAYGIEFNGKNIDVSQNNIYDLKMPNGNTSSLIAGIVCTGGSGTGAYQISNNMISLGSGVANSVPIRGIINRFSVSASLNVWYNSVFVGGEAPPGGMNNTACFDRQVGTPVNIRNNILYNARKGGGKHVAISNNAGSPSSGWNSENNFLVSAQSETLGLWSFIQKEFSAWQSISNGDGAYTATLIAANDCGADTIELELDIMVGTIGQSFASRLSFYPNPATGVVNLDLGAPLEKETPVWVSNLQEQVVRRALVSGRQASVDLNGLPAGMYIVSVLGRGMAKVAKG